MPAKDAAPVHERPTLGAQLARQHELLMAQATKPARTSPQMIEVAERHAGQKDGLLRLASLQLVQEEGESDVAFLGRIEETTRNVLGKLDSINTDRLADAAKTLAEAAE